ncbi:aldo/keto reductase [Pelagicoccus mobilis]|uniref:Aldo/keto reductase n=1 Tax=Pelagicoccus mobilis TaxID=415221 RepID=A0A934VQE3_9BACT|nr:aldo/keto reductase [Pelagicoccus mobilis]MBK1876488.1 aldo/keto reductase [Pelagicoccus mobilis]
MSALKKIDPSTKQVPGSSDRLGAVLPKRSFGRSGELVTNLGVGGWHIGNADGESTAQEIIESALEEGIRFFDTAPSYQDGRSEYRYGKFLVPNYRDDVFLLTKTKARTGAEAIAEIETSLARMKTDRIDAVLMHAISSNDDADERRALEVVEGFQKAKEQGKVRYLGFSGHLDTKANLHALEIWGEAIDVSLCPVNAIDPSDSDSFITNVLPKMVEMGVAPLAMKSAAYGNFFTQAVEIEGLDTVPVIPGRVSMKDAFEFVLAQSICCWVSGMDSPEFVAKNAKIAREFKGMDKARCDAIVAQVAAYRDNKEIEIYRRWG